MKFAWTNQPQRHNGHQCHPNDETVPMDIVPPVFTQVRQAYTKKDKVRFKNEGRCFNCDRQGHKARKLLHTNDHLEFLTTILTADTEEGLLRTATFILQSYYSRFTI